VPYDLWRNASIKAKWLEELVMYFSFLVIGLLLPFSDFFIMVLEEYGV
jgi:hypothetical protein